MSGIIHPAANFTAHHGCRWMCLTILAHMHMRWFRFYLAVCLPPGKPLSAERLTNTFGMLFSPDGYNIAWYLPWSPCAKDIVTGRAILGALTVASSLYIHAMVLSSRRRAIWWYGGSVLHLLCFTLGRIPEQLLVRSSHDVKGQYIYIFT